MYSIISKADILSFIPIFVAFAIAYPISILEYGYRKFRKNYLLLFRISLPFHLYGITHGVLAGLIYWILLKENYLPTGEVADVLNPLTVGLGIKGITNLNFYNIVSSKVKSGTDDDNPLQMTPVGPKLIMDSIEKYCETLIEDSHDYFLDRYIHRSLKQQLSTVNTETLLMQIPKYLPHSLEKVIQIAFMDALQQSLDDNNGDPHFAMRLFVNEYGLNRYKKFIQHFNR